jgi:hypothetical protein
MMDAAPGGFPRQDDIPEVPPKSRPSPPPPPGKPNRVVFRPTPYVWRDPKTIPPREFVYGRHYIRKFISATVAPGGMGKTSLTIVETAAMATGRNLVGDEPCGLLRVWGWNGEDPREEIERRFAAACLHYKIDPASIEGNLFFDSGRDIELIIATQHKSGALIATPVEDALIEALKDGRFDVLILDPFVSTHRVSENDNMAIDAVVKTFGRIAEGANCAIELIHHVRKTSGAEITAEDGRGASALVAAARSVRVLNQMALEEAEKAGIDPNRRKFFFRSDIGKANLSPPSEKATWFNLASVPLGNGRGLSEGDIVGVATAWEWPDAFEGVTVADLRAVQAEINKGRWREDVRAKGDWAGAAVAKVLKLDPTDKAALAKIKRLIKTWIENGMLKVVKDYDEDSKLRPYIVVGKRASD